jgi:hypothetical protein
LQPFGQAFELLVCVELVQAVNADLNSPVRAAFLVHSQSPELIAAHGARTIDEAIAFVADLKKKGRYQQDVY